MENRKLMYSCIAVFLVSLVICVSSPAQRAIENADQFAEKAVEQAEDGNVRAPSNSNAQIEWDDTKVSGGPQAHESQQDQ